MRKGSAVTPCVICKKSADWKSPTGHWACQTCRDDFPKVAQFRDQAHQRAVQRQRIDAAAATARLEPLPDTADEVEIQRDTVALYASMVDRRQAFSRWQPFMTWELQP